ncbi:SRPBCC family protein [Actinoplanes awajinensis]|uniref:ATPase n=1 Tax=Actinoplanes awajinensis subsp. mycoplanecinus TaxID=135947 RepID=A0A117MLB3_9ACTN|nr:SRPBCC family protein [Actinoplanes awajinensis]KUL23709.1 ATPase [Actinoplanes awajinensis subsp. mycoplanecinus]
MTSSPIGRLFPGATGPDLVLTRTFRAPIEDVWASVTESDRTARWFGPWEGDAAPGRTIKMQMAFEDQQPWFDVRVDACDPPRRLSLSTSEESGGWRLELVLSEAGGRTELRFVHHLTTTEGVGEMGPGWEYYLDMLVAARDGLPAPTFDDYYPSMKPYYDALTPSSPPGDD